MATANAAPIIIKKPKKGGGHGHHGGAWKVAYADFVTAMMAFFLLLWLLSSATEQKLQGISDYFAPASISQTVSGAGGTFGGRSPVQGDKPFDGTPIANPEPAPVTPQRSEGEQDSLNDNETAGRAVATIVDAASEFGADGETSETDIQATTEGFDFSDMSGNEAMLEAALIEEAELAEAAEDLRKDIRDDPETSALNENVKITQNELGLVVEVIDTQGRSMFDRGSDKLAPHALLILGKVSKVVAKRTNKISIEGHTDAVPFAPGNPTGNWELSAARANAARRALVRFGLSIGRMASVTGKADTELLMPARPEAPENRRISLTLIKENPRPVGGEKQEAPIE